VAPKIEARPLVAEDEALIRAWIAEPEVRAWWGDAASAEAAIAIALTSATAVTRIMTADGRPFGYGHAVDDGIPGHAGRRSGLGAWRIDAFIGDAAFRGRGYGPAILDAMALEVFATTLALAVSVIVPLRHERVARAAERAGFTWSEIVQEPGLGRCWLMLRDRP